MREYYFIYKTTCIENGKYYVGQHKTHDKNDTYLGSGFHLLRAVKKYGRDAFIREILIECNSREELNMHEIQIVDEEMINDPLCYNLALGGRAGRSSTITQEHKAKIKASFTDARREAISQQAKCRWENDPKLRTWLEKHNQRAVTDETRLKMSLAHKGRPQSDEHKSKRANSNRGKKRSKDFCQKMSDIAKNQPPKSVETIAKIMKLKICPHCGKEGKPMNMGRWHFDKCKQRKI